MPQHTIHNVCIIGSGFMGMQIGLQCAVHGFSVTMVDVSEDRLSRVQGEHDQELGLRVAQGTLAQNEKTAILNRLQYTVNMEQGASTADVVIESVPEKLELKQTVFEELDRLCPDAAILATNSSSLRISLITKKVGRGDRVLNFHCYPPVWERNMVELMRGPDTSEETIRTMREFAFTAGLVPLMVLKESTGFLFNRVWRAIKKECLHLVDDGVASYEDVDRAWMIFTGMKIGPFGLMDLIGLDVIRDIENVYYRESGDASDKPPPLLEDLVAEQLLGVKEGRGFYTYPDPPFQKTEWLQGRSDG